MLVLIFSAIIGIANYLWNVGCRDGAVGIWKVHEFCLRVHANLTKIILAAKFLLHLEYFLTVRDSRTVLKVFKIVYLSRLKNAEIFSTTINVKNSDEKIDEFACFRIEVKVV